MSSSSAANHAATSPHNDELPLADGGDVEPSPHSALVACRRHPLLFVVLLLVPLAFGVLLGVATTLAVVPSSAAASPPSPTTHAYDDTPKRSCLDSLPPTQDFCARASDDRNFCATRVALPSALSAHDNQSALAWAFGEPGMGAVCCGVVVSTRAPLPVYRAWSTRAARLGTWWSLSPPPRSRDLYRTDSDICYAWNPRLANVTRCTLRAGALGALGRGQSTCCPSGNFYAESPALQLAVPSASSFVADCVDSPWHSSADADADAGADAGASTRSAIAVNN